MQVFFFIALIVWAVYSKYKRNQRADEARKRSAAQARQASEQEQTPKATPAPEPMRPRVQPTVQSTRPVSTPQQSAAGNRHVAQPTVQSSRPVSAPQSPQNPTDHRHVVQPSRETGHVHTESSISGFENCPPNIGKAAAKPQEQPISDRLAAYKAAKRAASSPAIANADTAPQAELHGIPASPFRWDANAVRDGLIYAEILGKPKALRR